MKRVILFCALAALALSCKNDNSFKADFDIAGVKTKMAYVTVFGDSELTRINFSDSARTVLAVEDGRMTVSGVADQPAVLRISFSDDKNLFKYVGRGYYPNKASSLWMVAEPGLNAVFKGDLADKNQVDIYPDKGPENKMLARLLSQLNPLQNEIGDISVKIALDTTLTEADIEALRARQGELGDLSHECCMNFINENPSCIASLWLMEDMLIRREIEPVELDPILEQVDPKYYDNYFYYTVKGRIEGAKASAVGCPCPRVAGTDAEGNAFDIKSLRGKYVIIDFWGTWCGACLDGMPDMKVLHDANSDKLEIVGLARDKDEEVWKKCIAKYGMNWPNLLIGTGEDDFAAKFNVQGYPTKILLDPQGTIIYRITGESEEFYSKVAEFIR